MFHSYNRLAGTAAALCCALASTMTQGQVVSDAAGTIDLEMHPYWDHITGTNTPTSSQIVSVPIGLVNTTASIDGTGYYSVGGISSVDYRYTPVGSGGARFDFDTYASSLGREDGGRGRAGVELGITVPAPVRFRFEADVIGTPILYAVTFNGVYADASYDAYFGGRDGTFPLIYIYEDGVPVFAYDWDIYVHEGVLPAGTYHLSTEALSAVHGRYGLGLSSRGTASLHIQLLGDADQDGLVGIDDMNIILAHWGRQVPAYASDMGDLDGDGTVGIADLNQVLGGWGSDVRQIPEPACVAILGLLPWVLTGRRRSSRTA